MQKFAKKLSILMVALMTIMTVASYMPAKAATVVPKVQFVGEQKLEYKAGERITFNLNAANYGGRVQYRVVLWNDNTKSYSDLWNTADRYYANWMPYGNETLPLGWTINEPGSYRITVYVKRAGLANSKTANPGANCDSFVAGPAFVVKAAVSAEEKVAAYEKAPLVTADDITKAEALQKEAVAEVAKVTNETDKAAFTARIEAQNKKLEEAKYVHVKEVLAIDKNTLKVTFNKEVAGNVKNFKIFEKNNEYVTMLVKEVKVEKEVAMVTLYNDLVEKTAYVVEVSGAATADAKFSMKEAETKEFTFVKATPATITFKATKILKGEDVVYVVKDANGNDITANYPLASLTVQVANETYVNKTTLKANSVAGATIVNLIIKDTEIQTGNTIIEVVDAAPAVLASLGRYSLGNTTYAEPTVDMYKPSTAVVTAQLNFEMLKADGKAFVPVGGTDVMEYIYSSSNPTVALVDSTGMVTALSEGTAYITVIATQKNTSGTVLARKSAQYAVTVKGAKKASALKIEKTYVKLVKDSGLTETIKITVLDQYGNKLATENGTLTVKFGTEDTSTKASVTPASLTVTSGVATVVVNAGTATGSVQMSFGYGSLAKVSATAETVAAAAFNGYVAEIGATTLDHCTDADLAKGTNSTTVRVFRKDVNGNKIEEVVAGAGSNQFVVVKADSTKTVITTAGAVINATAGKTGTETVYVKVNGITVGTFSVTVVDSTPVLTKTTQSTDALAVNATISLADFTNELFGVFGTTKYTTKGIFVGFDQYGNEFAITSADYKIYSNNVSVINTVNGVVTAINTPAADTKVLLIIELNGEFKQVEVLVKK